MRFGANPEGSVISSSRALWIRLSTTCSNQSAYLNTCVPDSKGRANNNSMLDNFNCSPIMSIAPFTASRGSNGWAASFASRPNYLRWPMIFAARTTFSLIRYIFTNWYSGPNSPRLRVLSTLPAAIDIMFSGWLSSCATPVAISHRLAILLECTSRACNFFARWYYWSP